ncbi:MAG: hypothetical protein IT324_12730 [Anaerolineae bacterium]|nr:hypothetical protein [Anaerolineae bacterium]
MLRTTALPIRLNKTLLLILLCALITLLLTLASIYRSFPQRDSGVFLYIARAVLNGQIPYRDVWDHKGPLIYYIDSVGLILGNGTIYGVWALEIAAMWAVLYMGFALLRQAFGSLSAIFASVIFFASFLLAIDGGNLIEEFALPFQFAALYLFVHTMPNGLSLKISLLLGILLCGCFLLRVNVIGVFAALVVVWLVQRPRLSTVFRLLLAGGVAAVLLLLVLVYFASQNALNDFVEAYFRFNFAYSSVSWAQRLGSLQAGIALLAQSGISIIALTGWVIAATRVWKNRQQLSQVDWLLLTAIIDLPIELILVTLSGNQYHHYYLTWLPCFTILTAVAVDFIHKRLRRPGRVSKTPVLSNRWLRENLVLVLVITVIGLQAIRSAVLNLYLSPNPAFSSETLAARYIVESTQPEQSVLVWGSQAVVNYIAERRAPTRFVYQLPLYWVGYNADAWLNEMVHDLDTRQPAIIIDASIPDIDYIPPLNPALRQVLIEKGALRKLSGAWDSLFNYVQTHYEATGPIEGTDWIVWRLRR